ncbi:hypothetical protein ALC62_08595 [Cyphomyrmex costatus]|uniref:Uncharacterized protein n=1 Tax=Cyphomyrmex costatus TaxID=456900 RepID=A0A151IGR4_9HYME|nr:hypothetical protein ALC62_08595 [Cyphomyrmex costatus]
MNFPSGSYLVPRSLALLSEHLQTKYFCSRQVIKIHVQHTPFSTMVARPTSITIEQLGEKLPVENAAVENHEKKMGDELIAATGTSITLYYTVEPSSEKERRKTCRHRDEETKRDGDERKGYVTREAKSIIICRSRRALKRQFRGHGMPIGKSVPICSMKRRLGRMASHDVTECLEKLDARLLEGHFAMRLPGRLVRDIRSRWKTSHSKVIFNDFIATGEHLLSSRGKEKLISSEARAALHCEDPRCYVMPITPSRQWL